MTKKLLLNSTYLYGFLALCLSALFVLFSVQCYYADSEIWLLTLSQKLFHVDGLITIYYKWTFHAFIYLFSHFAPTELDVYSWARIGCAMVGLGAAALTASVYTRVFENKKLFFPLFIFLLSSYLYFNQAFRIRADIFSYFLHILIIWFLLRMQKNPIRKRDHLLLFFLNLLLLTTSPKVIYFFVAQLFLALRLSYKNTSAHKKDFFWFIWLGHLSCVLLASLGGALSFVIHSLPSAPLTLSLAADFFIGKFSPDSSAPAFGTLESFQYLFNFLFASWAQSFVLLIAAVGLLWNLAFRKVKKQSSLQLSFILYSLILLFFTLLHNDKLPFFLGPMLTPILACAFMVTCTLVSNWKPAIFKIVLFIITSLCLFQATSQYEFNVGLNPNYFQRQVISQLNKYEEQHAPVKIYDVIGLLPRKTEIFVFVGPGEESEKQNLVSSIKAQDPDIIIYSFKAQYLEPQLGEYLRSQMVQIEEGVWAKGQRVSLPTHAKLFKAQKVINGTRYWILPVPKEKFVYDTRRNRMINAEILRLNPSMVPTEDTPKFIAVPMNSIFLGLSDFEPPALLVAPEKVFRFDTGF
jgi:hypothetical protein